MAKRQRKTTRKDAPMPPNDEAVIALKVYDGTRNLIAPETRILLRVKDGQQKERFSDYVQSPSINIKVPFFNNFGDNYTVLVTADGYRDAGFFPVKVSSQQDTPVDLMLVPKNAEFAFLSWDNLKSEQSAITTFFSCDGDEGAARQRYEDLANSRERKPVLASLMNLTAAMSTIFLPSGTPLDYFKEIEWDNTLAQDRFFGFTDHELVTQVRTAASHGLFAPEPNPGLFHGDATSSFKQVQFGEANVQLTFHENTVKDVGGVQCIRVEPDIDYYKDLGAHALLEVIPNKLTHGLTDPQMVYVLRWIAGRHAGVPEFDPGYTLVHA
jgi:hypothetical protein